MVRKSNKEQHTGNSVGSNYIFSLIYQVVNLLVQVILLRYLTMVIGAKGIGIQSYTNSVVSYFVMFSALGINWYGQKEIALRLGDKKSLSQCFWKLFTLKAVWSLIVLPVYGILIIASSEYRIYYIAMFFTYFAGLLDISWLYQGLERFDIIAIRNTVIKVLGMILTFAFVKTEEDVLLYVVFVAISNFAGNASMWLKLSKMILPPGKDCFHFRECIRPAVQYFIPTIATTLYLTMDKTMIGMITADNYENGYYEQAIQITNMLKTIVLSYNAVMVSRMAFLFAQKEEKHIKEHFASSRELILTISWPIVFGFAMVEREFVTLYFGAGNERIGDVLLVFAPVILIVGLSNMVESHVITPLNKREIGNKIVIIGAIVNFVLNLLLIRPAGAVGAAGASVISEVIVTILYVKNSMGMLTWKDVFQSSIKKILAAFMMSVVICLLKQVMNVSVIALAVQIVLGSITYIGVLILLKDSYITNKISFFFRGKEFKK